METADVTFDSGTPAATAALWNSALHWPNATVDVKGEIASWAAPDASQCLELAVATSGVDWSP